MHKNNHAVTYTCLILQLDCKQLYQYLGRYSGLECFTSKNSIFIEIVLSNSFLSI